MSENPDTVGGDDIHDYAWPMLGDRLESDRNSEPVNACAPPTVLRYRRAWDGKLFPVWMNIDGDRWPSDNYHADINENALVTVRRKDTGIIVHVYAPGSWQELKYEFQESLTSGWLVAVKLEEVPRDAAES